MTPVCGHLDFNCLKLKYEVLKSGVWMSDPYLRNESHYLSLLSFGTGVKQLPDTQVNFSPLKEFTLVLLDPELTLVLLIPFLKTLDPDQLASLRGYLTRIYTVFHTNGKYRFKLNRIKFGRSVTV